MIAVVYRVVLVLLVPQALVEVADCLVMLASVDLRVLLVQPVDL